MSDLGLVVVAGIAFAIGVLASGCETAFFAADRLRLRHLAATGSKRAAHALDLSSNPEHFLSTLLVSYNLAEVGCTAVYTALATRWFGDSATTVVTLVLVPVWLVFNQIIPKSLFLYYATPAAVAFAGAVRAVSSLLYPLVKPLSLLTDALTRFLPADPSTRLLNVSTEELLFHIGDSRSAGLIAPETTALIDRAIELKQLAVRDVVRPIDQVVMLDADAPIESYAQVIAREGFSRYPVYRGDRGNVIGILSVHEYVTSTDREALRAGLRPPFFVAASAALSDVLVQMREGGRHMALVRESGGEVAGITTLDDILRRLVGAIVDEFD
ncbi:MAG: hemolysin family protein [Candidatus Latescibacteria bacterium]|nr:hemolysin family protein [Candidatus Latescibacterota bacterium]